MRNRVLLVAALVSACVATEPPPDKATVAQEDKADWTLDPCEHFGWYEDGECDWFCPRYDDDCTLGEIPSGAAARYPIVLAHGFDASPTNRWGWNGVAEALRADGHTVIVATVPPYDAVSVRAAALATYVDRALAESGAGKVHLLAHSMGGLDARHVISVLGYGDRVASLTTISTPHRGTAIADVILRFLPSGSLGDTIDALASSWGLTYSEVAEDSHVRAAMNDLAEANAAAFAASHPDDARVYYQSWAGVSSVAGIPNPKDVTACDGKFPHHSGRSDVMDATLVANASLVAHGVELLPNDGIATVASARHGVFRGCIPADHLDEVGQEADWGPNSHTGFDHLRFYRNLAFELSARGW